MFGFIDQCVFMIFSFTKLIYDFISLSLKHVHGNGVVYLTVLAPLALSLNILKDHIVISNNFYPSPPLRVTRGHRMQKIEINKN